MSKKTFSPQPYPLYVWGLWATKIEKYSYEYNVDRLTVAGWMDNRDGQVEPMVITINHGVVPLRAISYDWTYAQLNDYPFDEEVPVFLPEDQKFLVADISMSEPGAELYTVLENLHSNVFLEGGKIKSQNKDLVV